MDEKNVIEVMEKELKDEVERLGSMVLGSDEYTATIEGARKLADSIAKLKDVTTNEKKVEIDISKAKVEEKKIEIEERKVEVENYKAKLEKQKVLIEKSKVRTDDKQRKWNNGIAIASIGVPFAGLVWANIYNWYKESEGIMSSTGGKDAMRSLFGLISKRKM